MRINSGIGWWILLMAFCLHAHAQMDTLNRYSFINYDENKIILGDSAAMDAFNGAMDEFIYKGTRKVNILHIGDSHIQADWFSGEVRRLFHANIPHAGLGGRGFLFPYRLAGTNNPANYKVRYTGNWDGCRCVHKSKGCDWGLAGIVATTFDDQAEISVYADTSVLYPYQFTKVRVYYPDKSLIYNVSMRDRNNNPVPKVRHDGYTEFLLGYPQDTLTLYIRKVEEGNAPFVLQGIMLDNNMPGIVYSSLGVNGADVESWLICKDFDRHLSTIDPDLVVISLGTNDAYAGDFDGVKYRKEMEDLILRIKKLHPEVSILLTSPGDSYRYRKYQNPRNAIAANVLKKLAEAHGLAVWDFFTVMGGLNSINYWYRNGLTAKDKLHLSKSGYLLQGQLMYEALMDEYLRYRKTVN